MFQNTIDGGSGVSTNYSHFWTLGCNISVYLF